jgi:hypothetical protein
MKTRGYYRGKNLNDMTREELMDALEWYAMQYLEQSREHIRQLEVLVPTRGIK